MTKFDVESWVLDLVEDRKGNSSSAHILNPTQRKKEGGRSLRSTDDTL